MSEKEPENNIHQDRYVLGENEQLRVETPNGHVIINHFEHSNITQVAVFDLGGDNDLIAMVDMKTGRK